MLKIGVLDFGESNKENHTEPLSELFEVVPQVEKLGFSRYWLAEHYEPGHAWKSPEILIGLLAGITEKIKIGIAGILILYHNPLRVALNFKLLGSIFEDRIDLGIARADAPENVAKALLETDDKKLNFSDYEKKVESLLNFLQPDLKKSVEENPILTPPENGPVPEAWILGSGGSSALTAIKQNTNYCLSLFHKKDLSVNFYKNYLKEFRDKYEEANGRKPNISVCLNGTCAESEKEAKRIAMKNYLTELYKPQILGDPNSCKEQLLSIKEELEIDEIIFLDLGCHYEYKLQSYHLLSEVFNHFEESEDKNRASKTVSHLSLK